MVCCARYGSTTVGGCEQRTGTSRFLVQGVFVVYKLVMGVYFTFWAVYWPRAEGFRKQAVNQLTFWTWDVCAGYFVISTVAALVCWRAMRKNSGPNPGSLPPAASKEKDGGADIEGQAADSNRPEQAPSSTTPLSTSTAWVSTTAEEAGAGAAQTGGRRSPVPRWLQWPLLLLWNVACVGSLIIPLVWFTEDYVRQVKQGVKNFDIQAHGLISFFLLLDQVLIADDFKLKHMVISQVYGMLYVVFSIFWFYMAPEEDKYLYEDYLDWEDNRTQACIWAVVSLVVVVPLAALVHFALCRMREAFHGRIEAQRTTKLKRKSASILRAPGTFHV